MFSSRCATIFGLAPKNEAAQTVLGLVQFMFSKQATKIDKIFTIDLTLCSKRQIDAEDFVNFCGLFKKHELYTKLDKKCL